MFDFRGGSTCGRQNSWLPWLPTRRISTVPGCLSALTQTRSRNTITIATTNVFFITTSLLSSFLSNPIGG